MNCRLLDALHHKNSGPPPVWLMRQAGRYLPEYRALRKRYSLRELFFTPDLAAEITLQPLRRFGFDAAILFSDISVVAPALGLTLWFNEGPCVAPQIEPGMPLSADLTPLEPIFETVRLLKRLSPVPLIGFCGGPFTVATYLIARGEGEETSWLRRDPEGFAALLDHICDVSIAYLQGQVAAGVNAVQIFDSWANLLTDAEFDRFSIPYFARIVRSVPVPVIAFARGSGRRVKKLAASGVAAVSVDWEVPLSSLRAEVATVLQGNLNPDQLFASPEMVRAAVIAILKEMRGDPAFIFNLGHGVKPGTPLASVASLVDTVRNYA